MALILAFLVCGAIFFAAVFIHQNWLRNHTSDWATTSAEVLNIIDGGEGPDRYLLQYVFDGKVYASKPVHGWCPSALPVRRARKSTFWSTHIARTNVQSSVERDRVGEAAYGWVAPRAI